MTKSDVLDMVNKLDDNVDIVLNVQGAIISEFHIEEGVDTEMDVIQNEICPDYL